MRHFVDCRAAISAANKKETAAKIAALQFPVLMQCGGRRFVIFLP
jgi:hypothetical protein